MEEKKEKKSGLVIIVILLLLIIFAVWFFVLKDKGINNESNNGEGVQSKEIVEYDYRDGVLNRINDVNGHPKQNDFVIDGVILIGNRHSYVDSDDTVTIFKYFEDIGYQTSNINSSFYMNERIEMYVKDSYSGSNEDVKILITPHKTISKYEKMSFEELNNLALEKGSVVNYEHPYEDLPTYIADPYVNSDLQPGKYDILFTYKNQIAYFIVIDLTEEPIP